MKKSRAPIAREMHSVNCEAADYECDVYVDKGKQAYGKHRGFTGNLRGRAVCTIRNALTRLSQG